jgi:hypothetical protein
VNATLNSTSTVTVSSSDDVVFGSGSRINSTSGGVTISAAAAGGDIQMASGSSISAGSGAIELAANGNIQLGNLQTNAVGSAVIITSETVRHH